MWHHFFPLLFPKDSESLKILDIRLREVGAKRPLNGTSKVNRRTDRRTNRQTDGRTNRLIESIGPKGRCFENIPSWEFQSILVASQNWPQVVVVSTLHVAKPHKHMKMKKNWWSSPALFSKHRPSGPMLSISWNVRVFVCLCVCSLFEVPFKHLFAPTSRSPMSKNF